MEISFNIKDLLQNNNQVILPGLGVFYKNRIEGFFDEAKNAFFPPKETIEFTPSETSGITESEDPLLTFICNSKNVSRVSATYLLEKYVEDLKKRFQETGELTFEDVGKLKLQDSKIVLEAEESEKTGTSFFGLPVFTLPERTVENTTLSLPDTNFTLAEQALSAAVSDEELAPEPKSKSWLYILLLLIIVALGLCTLYLLRPDIYNNILHPNQHQPEIKNVIPVVTPEERETLIADSIYKDDVVKNLESGGFDVEKVKDSTDVTVNKKVVPNNNNIRYEIIIAAWQTRSKAEAHLKKLKENGINAHIVEDADGLLVKISAATLYNQQDAEREEKRIREELNPEAYTKPIRTLK
jgi:hypothetical protein